MALIRPTTTGVFARYLAGAKAVRPLTGYTSPLGRLRQGWTEWFWRNGLALNNALGQNLPTPPDRARALILASRGANPWYARDAGAGATNLQCAVRLGWTEVVKALLSQPNHWVWNFAGPKRWKQLHLASLWLIFDTLEMENLLWQKAPLSDLPRMIWANDVVNEHLMDHLCESGMIRTLRWLLEQMPEHFCYQAVRNSRVGGWALDSLLCIARHDPFVIEIDQDAEKSSIHHLLATTPQGLDLLRDLGVSLKRLDAEGNNALLTWCMTPRVWPTGPRNQHGWLSSAHEQDTLQNAQATLNALLSAGVDPLHTNRAGLTACEQVLRMEGMPYWWRLRDSFVLGVRERVRLLDMEVARRRLGEVTPDCPKMRGVSRL